jgi:hypothetical protein
MLKSNEAQTLGEPHALHSEQKVVRNGKQPGEHVCQLPQSRIYECYSPERGNDREMKRMNDASCHPRFRRQVDLAYFRRLFERLFARALSRTRTVRPDGTRMYGTGPVPSWHLPRQCTGRVTGRVMPYYGSDTDGRIRYDPGDTGA